MKSHLVPLIRRWSLAAALPLLLGLSACNEPAAPPGPFNAEEASRFLHQATMGATQADIDDLIAKGYEGWLTAQLEAAPADNVADYVDRGGAPGCNACNARGIDAVQEAFWFQTVLGKDQLRQRVAFALSELFVVSGANNTVLFEEEKALPAFHATLSGQAFGNFRVLLESVALHPAMGVYLSHLQNDKEDDATGRLPDENFAREVMQLFTIGKWQLNSDGSRVLDASGQPVPTYGQTEIMGMAKVFTGWSWGGPDTSDARWLGYNIGAEDTRNWRLPMQPYPGHHSAAPKPLVNGVVVPAGSPPQASVKLALDTLFNHPNVAPFVATHLIKRLVTSNPSPQYVFRVASVFVANDQGERGNLRSVVRAVLFDPEARSAAVASTPQWGKLREPVLRLSNLLRAFKASNAERTFHLAGLQTWPYDLGQTPWMAPSVFNFFQPEHAPADAQLSQLNLVMPEAQIYDESTSVGYVNYLQRGIESGMGNAQYPIALDFTQELALASNPPALVSRLAMLLNGGGVSSSTRTAMETAMQSVGVGSGADWALRRVRIGVILLMASPDYLIQK